MNKSITILTAFALLAAAACSEERTKMPWEDDLNNKVPPAEAEQPEPAEAGKPLPAWSEGCLDIHMINSGRGECTFYILPDGTTLLIDAGEIVGESTSVPQKPNENTRPYIVYANYIKHFLPKGKSAVDWCAPSHFHIDHIGSAAAATATSPNGYRLSGLMALYDEVPFARVLDMGYPDYGADSTIPEMDGELVGDWATFVKWAVANRGMTADRFRAGEEQITLQGDKSAYPDFRIFNFIANGYAWNIDSATGQGAVVNANAAKGNPASCGIHLSYGKFDYVACGDLTGGPQNRMAYYCRDFIPRGGVDVFKAHHHLSGNGWGSQMQNTEFSPRVILNQCFYRKQPDVALLTSIVTGNFSTHPYTWVKEIFSTNIHPETAAENPGLVKNVAGYNGHIVVRVAPGGATYSVFMLDDTDFEYRVLSIHGPYEAK